MLTQINGGGNAAYHRLESLREGTEKPMPKPLDTKRKNSPRLDEYMTVVSAFVREPEHILLG